MRQMNVKNEIKIDIPAEVGTLIDELNAAGFEAFAVGGCVRDSIMGKVPRDWDICTSAEPCDMHRVFSHRRVIKTGIKHGKRTNARSGGLGWRIVVALLLGVPIFLISMFPTFQFPHWGWVLALITLPVAVYSAEPFHRAALTNARHFSSTMDTLVSLGVIVAYLYSLAQLFMLSD